MTTIAGAIPRPLSPPMRRATHLGPDAFAHALQGRFRRRLRVAPLLNAAHRIETQRRSLQSLSPSDVLTMSASLAALLRRGRETDAHINQAFALVAECIRRRTALNLHAEQIAAALAMRRGAIAELATGEGKTLAALLPAAVAAWRGRGVHLVTANDYLARRDADSASSILESLGLTVACITEGDPPTRRTDAYRADLTYATSRELAADYLRDRLGISRVQRPLAHAIIDEADFVLIDDAATPLILSAPARSRSSEPDEIRRADAATHDLREGVHFVVDRRARTVRLTAHADQWIDDAFTNSSAPRRRQRELLAAALRAHHVFDKDRDYAVLDQRVHIIDERTGRISLDRRWRDGLHEAIEAKESLDIRLAQDTLASISFQRYFCLYPRLCGMTGTVRGCAPELWRIYWTPAAMIPTHHPSRRRALRPITVASRAHAIARAVDEASAARTLGRPVLIGTNSVEDSEEVGAALAQRNIPCAILNAVRHADEAQIIARAGKPGAVTVATSMAGRGTDITLDDDARRAGGLHVIALGHAASRRIDRQLFGRTARQGDPGSTIVIRSSDDWLLRRAAPSALRLVPGSIRFALTQSLAERRARHDRLRVIRQDRSLDDLLAFAAHDRPLE